MLAWFSFVEFLPFFSVGSFSYTSRAGFLHLSFLMWVVTLRHPMLALFLSGDFLLHIPCWLHFYLGSFSYASHAGYYFLFCFLSGEFLLHIPCWLLFFVLFFYLGSFSYTSHAVLGCFFRGGGGGGVSRIQSLIYFSVGSFSYTSHTVLLGFFYY